MKRVTFPHIAFFTAADWAEFRADTPLTLTEDEVTPPAVNERPYLFDRS